MVKTRALALALLCVSLPAWAFDSFVVKDIRVEGIQRTEAGTVFSYLPVKVGETLDDDKASEAIHALFATGFFKDVRLENDGGVLVVVVQERPAIARIDFFGIKEFDKEKLLGDFKRVGFAESRIFDKALLERAEQELKNLYYSKGKYSVEITTTVTPMERNRVAVRFDIVEGDVAKIAQINIVGNKVFTDKDLLKLFSLTTPNWMSWWTKSDQYSKEKLEGDLEKLRSFYLDDGYLDFAIDSTQVMITPDKKQIYITVNVNEGKQYKVADIKLAGDLVVPEDDLTKLIKLHSGDVFSRAKLTASTAAMADRLGNDGYAFANINAVPEVNKEKQEVSFTFMVDPGRRVYVRRIDIAGNSRTRDEVIRREMRQMEAAPYAGDKVKRSKERVDRLGYFNSVNVETPMVPDTADQVDMKLAVEERSTGSVLVGAGYSSGEGVILMGSINQTNWLGTGKAVGLEVNTSKVNTVYSLSMTEPYYTVDGISRGFDLYKRKLDTEYLSTSVGHYKTDTAGAGVRWGLPISETNSIKVGLAFDNTKIGLFDDSPARYKDYVAEFGNDNNTLRTDLTWAKDTRDSLIYTTKGTYQRAYAEVGLPVADLRYYKLSYQYQWWYPIGERFSLMLNGEVGYGDGYNGKPLPFYKNFYAGGVNSVRGYDTATLGPRDSDGYATGGNRRVVGNAELYFPFPGMERETALRMSVFVDGGQVWGKDDKVSGGDIRYSTGLGVSWNSPFGPLKFSYAYPINSQDGDNIQRFQFTMGSTF